MSSQPSIVWIAWENHTRNRSLSAELHAHLVQLDYPHQNRLVRYAQSISKTIALLWRWRSKIVIAQNPSIILCFLCVILRPLLRYRLVIDAHNAGIFPKEGRSYWLQKIADMIIRQTAYTIVTNQGMAKIIEEKNGRPIVLPDPLPTLHTPPPAEPLAHSVIFICSWAADEPFIEVFKAAEQLPELNFYVTGKSKGREQQFGRALPANIKLTGYLPELEYLQLLNSCDIVLDLTTRDHCLVCGAYEAVSCKKPFVLSNNQATQDYFRLGGTYCDNTAPSIASCLRKVYLNKENYIKEVETLHAQLQHEWHQSLHQAQRLIENKPL
ncbi:MAG TPA: hypothetical protein PKD17_03660 [Cellvibrionaceae bacterium]|nr:hypothetical protein [Cellvibrionaceae bacterium]HMW70887.1 hypothetical protein [Cellvibrionaceae bacterium]HMY38588.1 hypothetical protein [Marinagarivorans sp.]HNG59364.1 hypothetical protein [Cellvibrionaceae bacterium]